MSMTMHRRGIMASAIRRSSGTTPSGSAECLIQMHSDFTETFGRTVNIVGGAKVGSDDSDFPNGYGDFRVTPASLTVDNRDGALDFSLAEWTIEFFVKLSTHQNHTFLSMRDGAVVCPLEISCNSNGNPTLLAGNSTNSGWGINFVFGGVTIPFDVKTHVAVCQFNGAIHCFVAGVMGSTDTGTPVVAKSLTEIYLARGGDYQCPAKLEGFHIDCGRARYKADFTPPTAMSPT